MLIKAKIDVKDFAVKGFIVIKIRKQGWSPTPADILVGI